MDILVKMTYTCRIKDATSVDAAINDVVGRLYYKVAETRGSTTLLMGLFSFRTEEAEKEVK